MKVSEWLVRHYSTTLCKYRFIIVQHLLKDTVQFVDSAIKNGIEINCILYKQYSVDSDCYSYLSNKNLQLVELNENDDRKLCEDILVRAVIQAKIDGKKVVILDLGGEFAELISKYEEFIQCVVEDTHFGYWKYNKNITSASVYSVAESQLKELEAKFVGKAIVDGINRVLLDVGISLNAKKVLLIGYGMIGKNVAIALKDVGAQVIVNDVSAYKGVQVLLEGYQWCSNPALICKECDVIIGVTGTTSIDSSVISALSSNTYLVSGSSKQIEIDLEWLKKYSNESVVVNDHIDRYKNNGTNIYVLNDGKPVNFIYKSIPDEIIDLVFAEMIMCIIESEGSKTELQYEIHKVSKCSIEMICRHWLRMLQEKE